MIGQEQQYTIAAVAAARNSAANLRALHARQPALAQEVEGCTPAVEWVLGRDGSLTALDAAGAWWSGCSLPRQAAETILKKMELKTPVTCFLSPTHAAQVRVTLDRMTAGQALVAVVPSVTDLRILLACERFDAEIDAGRLWFAWGEGWARELSRLLQDNDGLPVPGQFVRTLLVEDEPVQAMIAAAQDAFAGENARRATVVRELLGSPARPPDADAICVVAPRAFRLWDDAGDVLAGLARHGGARSIDPDDALQASAVAFARVAAGCRAVAVANMGRAELPADLPESTRVLTWVTAPRLPQPHARGTADALLLADERWRDMAVSAGWPAERVSVAHWPAERREQPGHGLAIIADTVALATPEFDLSSQRVLWETIARELSADPFAAGDDAAAYLARWLSRTGIAQDPADRQTFVERLIVPACQQGLARWLITAGIEIKLFGRGWDEIAEFAGRHAGDVRDRESLRAAADGCAALVHAWPTKSAHPLEALGRPVLRRGFKGRELWLAEAKRLARGEGQSPASRTPEMSFEVLRRAAGLA